MSGFSEVDITLQVAVPRDSGTCTRCPIEMRTSSSSSSWTCQISIRLEYSDDGTRLDVVQEILVGAPIMDPAHVESMLRRAQAMVLCASIPPEGPTPKNITDLETTSTTARSFSQNVVCLDIAGEGLANLAFIDLPGTSNKRYHRTLIYILID